MNEKFLNKGYYYLLGFIFIAAIAIRTVILGYRSEFEDDECRLLLAISDKSFWQLFLPIGLAQSAPPAYLMILKLWHFLCRGNEILCHFFPYLCSIFSIFLFYKLSCKFLIKKYSILAANFLFSINIFIIYFTSVIKQYSFDVLICLSLALYLSEINILNLNKKTFILLAILILFIPFISLPALYFLGAFFILNLAKNYKNKDFYKKTAILLLPFLTLFALYYIFNLQPSKMDINATFPEYWADGFIYSYMDFIRILGSNLKIFFYPNKYMAFQLIVFFMSIWYCIKERTKISIYLLLVIFMSFLGAFLHLYPLYGRVSLYFGPILILFLVKPIDYISINKKIKSLFIIFILFVSFCGYNTSYFKNVLLNEQHYNKSKSKQLVKKIASEFNNETDYIVINKASEAMFFYYARVFKLHTINIIEINNSNLDILQNPNINKRYFVCLFKDYVKAPIFDKTLNTINKNDIKMTLKENTSQLLIIQKK